jgi:hypothetical protein
MGNARTLGLLFLLIGCVLFVGLGCSFERTTLVSMVDFKAVYYGSRCLLAHHDPYNATALRSIYNAEGAESQSLKLRLRFTVAPCVNLPATLVLLSPLALLPWEFAHLLWMAFTAASLILASYLIWDLGSDYAPLLSGILLCIFLPGQETLLEIGNVAGVAVSLCIIAVWCFCRQRFVSAGILCLALSLALKPHDGGLVWVFFLLAGGVWSKRALQSLALTILLSLPALFWVGYEAPRWPQELHANLVETSLPGAVNDPGPAAFDATSHGSVIINLQTFFSLFRDNPRFYNTLSNLICVPLLFLWAFAVLRRPFTHNTISLALAAAAPLTLLPFYHRQHDAALLLLIIPACAALWSRGGPIARLAGLVAVATAIGTSNLFLQAAAIYSIAARAAAAGWRVLVLNLLLTRPAPLILLACAIFYLWAFVRRSGTVPYPHQNPEPAKAPVFAVPDKIA